MAKIANRIREIRLERGLTQADLGRIVGVSRQSIISIERGRYVPSLELALRIAAHFGRPVERLFTLED